MKNDMIRKRGGFIMNLIQEQVDTPALLLHKSQLVNNIDNIAKVAASYGVHFRPHIKTHKSKDIARLQITRGATGLTAAKVGEAEMLIEAGLTGILIARPVSHQLKVRRIQKLREQARIIVAVDPPDQGTKINNEWDPEKPLEVWIKVH